MKAVGIIAVSSALLVGTWWFLLDRVAPVPIYEAARHSEPEVKAVIVPESVFFLGDIMLARDVEKRLVTRPVGYAFQELSFLKKAVAVVGNFEAVVPEIHEATPNMVMKFSVPVSLLPVVSDGGVTHLSLANNHALDYGEEGHDNTRRELQTLGLQTFGHPVRVDENSVKYIDAGGRKLGIIGINATYGDVPGVWQELLAEVSSKSDIQVIFIHWGIEYESVHSESQETLAHLFIDGGADLVIGHHPHVVQDIEKHGDGLIFYSLGNFIFDQYWNDEVSEGLVLELSVAEDNAYLSLLPVESKTTRVQPRLMPVEEKKEFLAELAARSSEVLARDIMSGRLSLQF